MKTKHWLILIFLITIAARLILAFTVPNLTYDSYFHIRQVEHITNTGLPLYTDDLSYGGRQMLFLPAFHYIMAFFNLFLPIELVAKILPNLLIASLTIIVFLTAKKITKNDTASLLSAFIAGFLPILFTPNSFTPQSLFLPLMFLAIYTFLNLKKYLPLYILTFLLLSLTSPATFLLIMGFGIYLLLSLIEGKTIKREELELILFSLFFYIWAQFIFFKNMFIEQGISFIWHNVPTSIMVNYFPQYSIAQAIVLVSFIPFLAGVFIVYRSLFHLKNEKTFLLISFALSTTLLSWLRLIEFKDALAFFGVILAILFASFYKYSLTYLNQTRLFRHKKFYSILLTLLLIITITIPAVNSAFTQATPSNEEIEAFKWIKDNTPRNAVITASLAEGHLVTHFSQRKNLMDDQFGLVEDIEDRFTALNLLYTTPFETLALDLYDTYDLGHVILTPSTKEHYETKKIKYKTRQCFTLIYREESRIYTVDCTIQKT